MKHGQILLTVLALSILLLAGLNELDLYLHPKLQAPLIISAISLVLLGFRTRNAIICAHSSLSFALVFLLTCLAYFEFSNRFSWNKPTIMVQRGLGSSIGVSSSPMSSSMGIIKTSLHSSSCFSQNHENANIDKNMTPVKYESRTEPTVDTAVSEIVLQTNIPWLASAARENKWPFEKRVWIKGFILKNAALDKNGEIALARAIVSCCAADAIAIAIRIPVDSTQRFAQNSWYEFRGILRRISNQVPKRPLWDRYPNVLFANEFIFEPDSIVLVEHNIADPYIFYSMDEAEFRKSF